MIIKINNKLVRLKTQSSAFPLIKMRKADDIQSDIFSLTLNSNDESMGIAIGSGNYAAGTHVKISAIPSMGYIFSHWSDNNTDVERIITVSDNITLTAYFKRDITKGILTYYPNKEYVNPS